jgi:hypothetical protein
MAMLGTVKLRVLPTVIVSDAEAVQPLASVTVTVYMVVESGLAIGQHELGFERVEPFDHMKVVPPDAVRDTEPPVQIDALGPTLAGGPGFLVTSTESTELHPVTESVTVR